MGSRRLSIDVGNTETAMGIVDTGTMEVLGRWRLASGVPRTQDELRLLLGQLLEMDGFSPGSLDGAVIGSVVPAMQESLSQALHTLLEGRVTVIQGPEGLPIQLDVEEPLTVGVDRIVNTLAAARLYHRNTVAVDLGTATTYDCITADAVFLGGVIAPGIIAGEDWLARRTAKLPRVEFKPPQMVIGRRTETCLHSGLFYSVVDAVDGIVDRIKAEWSGADPLVVATGGYSALVAPHSRTIDQTQPNLTLFGLAMAADALAGG